eukprot:scaffold169859_cov33-Tisochrysis_lutea.AAC.2
MRELPVAQELVEERRCDPRLEHEPSSQVSTRHRPLLTSGPHALVAPVGISWIVCCRGVHRRRHPNDARLQLQLRRTIDGAGEGGHGAHMCEYAEQHAQAVAPSPRHREPRSGEGGGATVGG